SAARTALLREACPSPCPAPPPQPVWTWASSAADSPPTSTPQNWKTTTSPAPTPSASTESTPAAIMLDHPCSAIYSIQPHSNPSSSSTFPPTLPKNISTISFAGRSSKANRSLSPTSQSSLRLK